MTRTLTGRWQRPQRSRKKPRSRNSRSGCATAAACAAGPRAYMRKFALCRLCFRKLALEGDVTGVTKEQLVNWYGLVIRVTDCTNLTESGPDLKVRDMTDPIADMLTRIRNAVSAKHTRVDMPSSRLKAEIARILQDEGYIQGFKLLDDAPTATSDRSSQDAAPLPEIRAARRDV